MSSGKEERRYDRVRIINIVDGKVIEGHDTVKKHFEREQKLLDEYGASIIFQVHRLNLQADTLEKLRGKKLAEIKVDGTFVSGTDTVAVVKNRVRSLLEDKSRISKNDRSPVTFSNKATDHITLYLNGRPMKDDTAFYSGNPIMLPVWIQVLLHRCESEEAIQLINKLKKQR